MKNSTPIVELNNVSLEYENTFQQNVEVLNQISFSIYEGERVSIIGPSGCGKSSLLSLVSGFRKPTAGTVRYRGAEIVEPSHERVIIFQNYALFPWKTSIENIEFAIRARKFKGDIRIEAMKYLSMMNLEEFANSFSNELSGGMQQRIGIARALAAQPQVLLLDEPFASLDALTKAQVLDDVMSVVAKLRKTLIMVTHSIEESIFVSSKIIILSGRPSRIIEVIDANFEKPSSLSLLKSDKKFLDLEKKIHEVLIKSK